MAWILIIEDEEQLQIVLQRFLEDAGYRVVVVNSGRKGLQLMENQSFDLVITDILMPDVDGIEVIRKVRHLSTPPPPIIAISGGGSHLMGQELLSMAQALGVRETLIKPFSGNALLQTVKRVLAE